MFLGFFCGWLVSFVGCLWLVGLLISWSVFCFLLLVGWLVCMFLGSFCGWLGSFVGCSWLVGL